MRHYMLGAAAALLLGGAASAKAITFGEADTFEDGTIENWVVNLLGFGTHPAPPQNVEDGGPAGDNDNFMLLTSVGGSGAGSKMAVINGTQWSGNYLEAGVSEIVMDLKNFGDTAMSVRLLFEKVGEGGPTDIAVTNQVFTLDAGSGWMKAEFDLTDMTALLGTTENALSSATVIRIFHNPDAAFPGPGVVGSLGVDNIAAVPEPATIATSLIGLAFLARRRRKSA